MAKLFLQNRSFRSIALFATFGGIGRGMFSIIMMWIIHAMFQNPMYTGIAGFMFGAPLVAGFIVGPFVDRWNKANILKFVEFTKFIVVALLLIAYIFFYLSPWLLFPAIFIFSVASMFGAPALTAILPRVVASEDLVKANVFMNMLGLVGGIGLGATLLTLSTSELNFTLFYSVNAILLLIASLLIFILRYKEPAYKPALKTYFSELGEGFTFVKKGAMLFLTIAIMSFSFFNDVSYVNFPMLIDARLGEVFSYMLFSFLALTGSLIGSVICRAVASKFKLWQILAASLVIAGATRILFVNVLDDNFTRAVFAYFLYIGFGAIFGILYHVLIQKLSPKHLISRVTATTTSLAAVAAAMGALIGGVLGTLLYVDMVFFIQGGAYIAAGILLCFCKPVRSLPKISELGKDNDNIAAPE